MINQDQFGKTISPTHQSSSVDLRKTKNKLRITKGLKFKKSNQLIKNVQPTFNDPLYEYLDNEVYNKEQHNFGPWVEHERVKSRQNSRIRNTVQYGLPVLNRPEGTITRYYQQQQNIEGQLEIFPLMREQTRHPSLQQLKRSFLQFKPTQSNNLFINNRKDLTLKKPFFLKMQSHGRIKSQLQQDIKRSNVIYNYCLNNEEPPKKIGLKLKEMSPKTSQVYLKLNHPPPSSLLERKTFYQAFGKFTNQSLFKQLKQHRLNKLK